MKTSTLLLLTVTTLNINLNFLPHRYLLVAVFFLILLDFITGVLKSVILDIPRTSKGYRETYAKFIQYMGAILMSLAMGFLVQEVKELTQLTFFSKIVNNIIMLGIVSIEGLSIMENLIAIDTKSPFARYIIIPLHRLLTFEIKNLFKK
jgi:phage-related holin